MNDSTPQPGIGTVLAALNSLELDGKLALEVPYAFEVSILLDGGVTVRDFMFAIDAWETTKASVTNHWGYIKAVALRRRADFMSRAAEGRR